MFCYSLVENDLLGKIGKLEQDLEMAQHSTTGRDTRFMRDELNQLENQLEQREKDFSQLQREMSKEKKTSEELAARAEEAEESLRKLRRENEQVQQDVDFYRRELEQKVAAGPVDKSQEAQRKINTINREYCQCMDDLQRSEEDRAHLRTDNEQLRQDLTDSVREMEAMTDEYNKMKIVVQQTDGIMDQLRRERDHGNLQVRALTEQLQRQADEEDPVMAAVNAKVEEWKRVLSAKDDEILEYQHMIRDLRDKLRSAQGDSDKTNIIALQQVVYELCVAVQERDNQVKLLSEQVEQYTGEMERNARLIQDLKKPLKKGPSSAAHRRVEELEAKVAAAERSALEDRRGAELAERDAADKDRELSETLTRVRLYESGTDGLEAAIAEIKEGKRQMRMKDRETEALAREINGLTLGNNELQDENEAFRERLGLSPKEEVDLSEFLHAKSLRQRQYKAENQVLTKEIERLEEERLELKKQIRRMVTGRELGGSTTAQLDQNDAGPSKLLLLDLQEGADKMKRKTEHLQKELSDKERDLEQHKTQSNQLRVKLEEVSRVKSDLEATLTEVLTAMRANQELGAQVAVAAPSLEGLLRVMEGMGSPASGKPEAVSHLQAQLDQMTGRNQELRQELRLAREEAGEALSGLAKAQVKVTQLESDAEIPKQSPSESPAFRPLTLPADLAPSSAEIISTLNEYAIRLLQEVKNKEESAEQLTAALEKYKSKVGVIFHRQGLLYKEHLSDKEAWQKERETFAELKNKMEEQRDVDNVRVQEFNSLLEKLRKDPEELRRQLAETVRQVTVLRVNEKTLSRRYTLLSEQEQQLRKDNGKLRVDSGHMQVAVTERMGYLQRYKEMAAYRITALQKALDESIPSSDLDRANKQYTELTVKYRDTLQRDNHMVQRTSSLEHLEQENASLREQISELVTELESAKEKLNTLEQAWEHCSIVAGDVRGVDKVSKALANRETASASRRITTLEMKELNERQRAEHAHKMCEHARNSLRHAEERNAELEAKFAELTKLHLEAQRVERELRDQLADSVSRATSDADRARVAELEKAEAELRVEASRLREVSDVAKMQVSVMEARQQSRDKETESFRRQVLDLQSQSDEKALLGRLHQQVVSLQLSEAAALGRAEALTARLRALEAYQLRAEQRLDAGQRALYLARQDGRGRARHLRQTVHALRRQCAGALPLARQEQLSLALAELQGERAAAQRERGEAREQRRRAEGRAEELEGKLAGLEELVAALGDAKGARKVMEWHRRAEEVRLQDMRRGRELETQREEILYLKGLGEGRERALRALEEELVTERTLWEERQVSWEQREVDLERRLDAFETRQQQQVVPGASQQAEQQDLLPDPSWPVARQLEFALRKLGEHGRTILETQASCRALEERSKGSEEALRSAQQNVLSRDRVINELRLRLPATAGRERLLADLGRAATAAAAGEEEGGAESQPALQVAHHTIGSLQGRLKQKEEVVKKYQELLARARREQEEVNRRHEEEVKALHQKLDLYSDSSLDRFKQNTLDLLKKPSLSVPTSKHLVRLAEVEQTVVEQDHSLSALNERLRAAVADADRQRVSVATQAKKHQEEVSKLEEQHAGRVKALAGDGEELRAQAAHTEKQLQYLQSELEAQKEANVRSPSNTMKSLVERLKAQLAQKEKQLKALGKALLELRSEMTGLAEQQIISGAAQREESLNVQTLVDKHTKELKLRLQELSKELQSAKESVRGARCREEALKEEVEELRGDLQRNHKSQGRLQGEKEQRDHELQELRQRVKRLSSGLQNQQEADDRGSTVENLQRKVRRLELELEKRPSSPERSANTTTNKEDNKSKEEVVRWEEGKKWQTRMEKVRNGLKEKEGEVEALSRQLGTLKDLYARLEQENKGLLRKAKGRGVTADHVVGVRSAETEKELEELRRRNSELEKQILSIRSQQALPRDAAVDDLTQRNRWLEERLHTMESQMSKEPPSRPSEGGKPTASPRAKRAPRFEVGQGTDRENPEPHSELLSQEQSFPHPSEEEADADSDIIKEEEEQVEGGGDDEGPSGQESGPCATEVVASEPDGDPAMTPNLASAEGMDPEVEAEENPSGAANPCDLGVAGDLTDEDRVTLGEETGPTIMEMETGDEPERHSTAQEDADPQDEPNADTLTDTVTAELAGRGCVEPGSEVLSHMGVPKRESQSDRRRLKTSGRGTGTPSQKDQDVQKENLKLSSENLELRLQLAQANVELPGLKREVADLKEMCRVVRKERAEAEKKLSHLRGAGTSGKTVGDLEKTVGLMKKVVERVQKENDALKRTSGTANQDKLASLQQQHETLKTDYEKLKQEADTELNARLESKTRGMEKIVMESERLRREIKREKEATERLRVTRSGLEVTIEKLESELEETRRKLHTALSRAIPEGADSKTWKASVVTRMYENKMKELEREGEKERAERTELKRKLKEAAEREEKALRAIHALEDQVKGGTRIDATTTKDVAALRRANEELEQERCKLMKELQELREGSGQTSTLQGSKELRNLLKASETEKKRLQGEVKKLSRALENFDPKFFDEIEDLKFNYNLEVKKNILLEEELRKVCTQFGVPANIPSVSIS
ncbi:centrosomal protein of 290 kDa isoform X3 [Gadus macrocephalus]|uniref:centrosomal protein of 290 kDa isoform X3 n=1 Tax=Gadus macrocephalus TaxID=80720 RepID=UPI0028CB8BE5|nr:centrosomal protein of 290 kDa isoform X3 [Gadus macrocephalus]